ncbi:CU044_2847 family protein [Actinacidiphila glaucinigra]|uniref:Trypsin-co-occurring domain-containing protein n=1 Tax=Actinacidiphila glaucinigra TaxID=235986 RepID=A0A239HJ76_9ACTN|nr:CU044_2847 family protein [Actinacidiphila glaucinigra]SNS80893.1 hypothetical protein SAMN05216252_108381 [Actinacidiphila glaucinigra]
MGDRARPIELPDGTTVWARVSRLEVEGGDSRIDEWEDVSVWDDLTARVEGLEPLVRGVAASVRRAASAAAPDEVSVAFGVEVSAKPGKAIALLADGEAKANLAITLTWRDRRAGGHADGEDPAR